MSKGKKNFAELAKKRRAKAAADIKRKDPKIKAVNKKMKKAATTAYKRFTGTTDYHKKNNIVGGTLPVGGAAKAAIGAVRALYKAGKGAKSATKAVKGIRKASKVHTNTQKAQNVHDDVKAVASEKIQEGAQTKAERAAKGHARSAVSKVATKGGKRAAAKKIAKTVSKYARSRKK